MNDTPVSAQELAALVDGELELGRQLALEDRIAQDPALQARLQALRGLVKTVRTQADYHAAPQALRERVLRQGTASSAAKTAAVEAAVRPAWRWQRHAIGLALVALLVWAGSVTLMLPNADEQLLRDAVASHVRSTLANRLIDVVSSDRHTVKPWLSARLDFAPPVKDLASTGAALAGGRVDYLGERPVAALVYRKRQHIVDIFIWPTGERDSVVHSAAQRGFNVAHGVRDGMAYWAVSDLNRDELSAMLTAQLSEP
ncbi:MAG TPA: anti-sigma factor [Albitalea sp.]|nr:anti-sigma factor [Albitalea sp.]